MTFLYFQENYLRASNQTTDRKCNQEVEQGNEVNTKLSIPCNSKPIQNNYLHIKIAME